MDNLADEITQAVLKNLRERCQRAFKEGRDYLHDGFRGDEDRRKTLEADLDELDKFDFLLSQLERMS